MTEPNAALVGRDELREEVTEVIKEAGNLAFLRGESGSWDDDTYQAPEVFADRIIALCTAARDAEIREALMSDEVVKALRPTFHDWEEEFRSILEAIGLHGDGTGGQG